MRVEKVVVGIDFSRASMDTAKWVAQHVAPDAELLLLHVLEDRATIHFPDQAAEAITPTPAEVEAAELGLRDVAAEVSAVGVRTRIAIGRAHDIMRETADEIGADLIVVGPHGNRHHQSRLLGTTADRLVRTTHTPVLVGAREPTPKPARIVAGVKDDATTASVMAWTRYLAQRLDARVTVVHAISSRDYSHMLSMAAVTTSGEVEAAAEVASDMRQETDRWLHETAEARFDAASVDTLVTHGNAADAMLESARREHAAVIVVGRHDTTNGFPALLGRTLRHVLHEAPCPVLVVPPAFDEIVEEPE